MGADALTDTLPYVFVNVKVTEASASTLSFICVYNSVSVYTPSSNAD